MSEPRTLAVPLLPGVGNGSVAVAPPPAPAAGDPAPNISVQVAFDAFADDPNPAWTDLATLTGKAPLLSFQTKYGRSYEKDDVQAARPTTVLDNADSSLTPGNVSSPYYPNVDADKQIKHVVVPPAPNDIYAATVARGFITKVDQDIRGGYEAAQATISSTDNSDALSLVKLKSDFATELLALGPYGYWPLGDPDGAEQAGDVSGNGRPALPLRSFVGVSDIAGEFKFGADAFAPSDASTGLTLTPTMIGTSTDSGWYLDIPLRNMPLAYKDGFTFVLAFRTSAHPANAMSLIEATTRSGSDLIQIYLEGGDQKLQAFIWPDETNEGNFTGSTVGYADGKEHLLVAVIDDDAKTLRIYIDGLLIGTARTTIAGTNTVIDGKLTIGIGTGTVSAGFPFYGDYSHVAVLPGMPLSTAQVARLWKGWLGFPGEHADDRIRRYLTYATWPAGTIFDRGVSPLSVQQVAGTDVLTAIKNTVATEQGLFFIGPDGTARFHSRHHRLNAVSKVTFNQDLPVDRSNLGPFTLDRSFILNDITGSRPGGATQRVVDEASVKAHRRMTTTVELALLTDEELYSAISWMLTTYSQGSIRVGSITLDPYANPDLWRWALGLEIGDVITLDDLPPTAPAPTMSFYIESRAIDGARNRFKVTFELSPADSYAPYWQLGVPGFSEIGDTTRLAA